MRFLPRRTVGAMGSADLLVVVVIADAVQNGMSSDYHSVTEAFVLAATIFGWATFIDWLDFRFPQWQIAAPRARPVIADGKFLFENLKREQVTEDELLAELRLHGQDSPRRVAKAFIEGDGQVSVILRTGEEPQARPSRKGA